MVPPARPREPLPERGELGRCGRGGGGGESSAEAGTRRSAPGATRSAGASAGPRGGLGFDEDGSRLGRPRAAAAQERSVESEARRAASWSTPAAGPGARRLVGACERGRDEDAELLVNVRAAVAVREEGALEGK